MSDENENTNDLYWHALNYRSASTPEAEAAWRELRACVIRLVAIEVVKSTKEAHDAYEEAMEEQYEDHS